MHRHPIRNRRQWTCHTQSDAFKEQCQAVHEIQNALTPEKEYVHPPCRSKITGIVQDQSLLQGYECRDCDFDICLNCLLHYIDQPSIENAREEEIRKLEAETKGEEYVPLTKEEKRKRNHDMQHE